MCTFVLLEFFLTTIDVFVRKIAVILQFDSWVTSSVTVFDVCSSVSVFETLDSSGLLFRQSLDVLEPLSRRGLSLGLAFIGELEKVANLDHQVASFFPRNVVPATVGMFTLVCRL